MSALLLGACGALGQPEPPASPPPLLIEALSAPVAWLVREIGGDRVVLREITPGGVDPQTFHPQAARIAALAEADLIVASGAGFEAWLALASVPTSRLVVASAGLPLIQGEGPVHRHGEGPEHSHAGPIPQVWLDPALYRAQADRIAEALVARDPAHAEDYRRRLAQVQALLTPLSADLTEVGGALADRPIVANHPTFAYLGRAAGWSLRWGAIDASDVDPGALRALIGGAEGALVLWDAAPSAELVSGAPASAVHRTLDPVAVADSDGRFDPIPRMRANIEALRKISGE